jgi:hypothetical protein
MKNMTVTKWTLAILCMATLSVGRANAAMELLYVSEDYVVDGTLGNVEISPADGHLYGFPTGEDADLSGGGRIERQFVRAETRCNDLGENCKTANYYQTSVYRYVQDEPDYTFLVRGWYSRYLGREPEDGIVQWRVRLLSDGYPASQMESDIANSPEAIARRG